MTVRIKGIRELDGSTVEVESDKLGGDSLDGDSNWAEVMGQPVEVTDGQSVYLTLDSLGDGTQMFDISTPDAPTVLEGGVYAITANIKADAGPIYGFLTLDAADKDAIAYFSVGAFPDNNVLTSASCTCFIPVGGMIRVRAWNVSGDTITIKCEEMIVQKVM